MTDATELLPCPFCGSDKINVERDRCRDGNGVFACIACHNCRAKTRETYYSNGNDCPQTYQNLRDTWNTRADIARPMTVAEAAKVLLTPDEKGNRTTVYDACEKRVKVYKLDAVLRALSQGGE